MFRLKILSAVIVLALAVLACATPFAGPQLNSAGTAVSQTLAAIQASTPLASPVAAQPTQAPAATSAPDLLSHPLYFLNNDKGGLVQIFRLAVDGKTVQQITFEPANVDSFDVSPLDGSIAYGSNNQLLLVDANGAGRRAADPGACRYFRARRAASYALLP